MRVLEVGVCGTDPRSRRDSSASRPRRGALVLGHESLAVVERDGHGFSRGDLVTATVRRSCAALPRVHRGWPGRVPDRRLRRAGITRLDGFARELVAEARAARRDPGDARPARRAHRAGVDLRARASATPRRSAAASPGQLERALVDRCRRDRDALDLPAAARGRRGLDGRARAARGTRVTGPRRALRSTARRRSPTCARRSAASTSSVAAVRRAQLMADGSDYSAAAASPACSASTAARSRSSSTGRCSGSTRSSRTASSSAA